jgi:hypothetical protein
MSKNPLIGYWRLISCDAIRKSGNRVPVYGRNPVGRLYYDEHGNMSVQIMRSGRQVCTEQQDLDINDGDVRSDHDGYQAYFATYTVDTEHRIICHSVIGSLIPEWTGSSQVRYYEMLSGDRLVLRTAPHGTNKVDGPIFELVWERAE